MSDIVPKLIKVEPLDNMLVCATFENASVKTLDIGGFGIVWNDSIDLDRRDIWEFGTP